MMDSSRNLDLRWSRLVRCALLAAGLLNSNTDTVVEIGECPWGLSAAMIDVSVRLMVSFFRLIPKDVLYLWDFGICLYSQLC